MVKSSDDNYTKIINESVKDLRKMEDKNGRKISEEQIEEYKRAMTDHYFNLKNGDIVEAQKDLKKVTKILLKIDPNKKKWYKMIPSGLKTILAKGYKIFRWYVGKVLHYCFVIPFENPMALLGGIVPIPMPTLKSLVGCITYTAGGYWVFKFMQHDALKELAASLKNLPFVGKLAGWFMEFLFLPIWNFIKNIEFQGVAPFKAICITLEETWNPITIGYRVFKLFIKLLSSEIGQRLGEWLRDNPLWQAAADTTKKTAEAAKEVGEYVVDTAAAGWHYLSKAWGGKLDAIEMGEKAEALAIEAKKVVDACVNACKSDACAKACKPLMLPAPGEHLKSAFNGKSKSRRRRRRKSHLKMKFSFEDAYKYGMINKKPKSELRILKAAQCK